MWRVLTRQEQQTRADGLRGRGAVSIRALMVAAGSNDSATGEGDHGSEGEQGESDSHNGDSDEHSSEDSHGDSESNDEHSDDHEATHEDLGRIPNEGGAAIRIISPQDGAVITDSEILVEIVVENFELDDDGSHWHVYVDGVSHGMVLGHDFDQALRGLEPGEHTIEVHPALGTHEELEDGSAVTVTVSE